VTDPSTQLDSPVGSRALRSLAAAMFFGVIIASPAGWVLDPEFTSPARVKRPALSMATFLDGSYAAQLGRYGKVRSRFVDTLRGHYNEALYRAGLFESSKISISDDGWACQTHTMRIEERLLRKHAAKRVAAFKKIKARADRLGVQILAAPVPDKVRIYPEKFVPGGVLTAAHASQYPLILEELRTAGIEALDLATVLHGLRAKSEEPPLFYKWDSHWTMAAMRGVSIAIQARLAQLGWDLGPRVEFHVPGVLPLDSVSDLISMAGFRSKGADVHEPVSDLVRGMRERKLYVLLQRKLADGTIEDIEPENPRAKLAVVGTSFSQHGLHWAVGWATNREVDHAGILAGGGPFLGIESLFDRIAAGQSEVRVVVWEFVERFYNENWFLRL